MVILLPVIGWMALVIIQRGERINSLEGRVNRLEEKITNFKSEFEEVHRDHRTFADKLTDAQRDIFGYPPAVRRKVEKSRE